MRRNKIVATIGPASSSEEKLEALAKAGVNVFRMNFSHGTHASHGEVIARIRALEKKLGTHFPIMLDTKGPEIRTGDLPQPIEMKDGELITLTVDQGGYAQHGKVEVSYEAFRDDVSVGDTVSVDSGVMSIRVESIDGNDIICKVLEGGMLGSRRHLNLPGKTVSLEPVTEKDWTDIKFGIDQDVDFIAQSFVRAASDVELLRNFLKKNSAEKIDIIAKIETREAAESINEIVTVSDGVMVARGDLGTEMRFTQLPEVQQKIIKAAEKQQKTVIVATQMLESMIHAPIPTRAEVSDVSLAIFQRSDATMLSGETASGEHPIKAVQVMAEISAESETHFIPTSEIRDIDVHGKIVNGLAKTVAQLADEMTDVMGIVVLSKSGWTTRYVSSFRPKCPIFSFSDSVKTARKTQLCWGVDSAVSEFYPDDPEKSIQTAKVKLLKKHENFRGKKYILLSGFLVNKEFVPTIQVRSF